MEEFKPDSDFRPDSSDRYGVRRSRSSYSSSLFGNRSFAISRQQLMIGLGLIVLLLLVLGISSALKGPAKLAPPAGVAKEITLGPQEQQMQTGANSATQSNLSVHTATSGTASEVAQNFQAPPPISATPTEGAMPPQLGQRRVELSGDLSSALMEGQESLDQATKGTERSLNAVQGTVAQGVNTIGVNGTEQSILPTGAATLSPKARRVEEPKRASNKPGRESSRTVPQREQKVASGKTGTRSATSAVKKNDLKQSLAKGEYTLQLSGASRPDTLNAFARQYNLAQYRVYETRHNGKPWYVLISGGYASYGEAKQAIKSLPTVVQAKQPWVKPMKQVQREIEQR